MGKSTEQKYAIKDSTSDSQVNSLFPYKWSSASLTFNTYFYLFLYLYITRTTTNNGTPHLKSQKNQNRKAALGRPALKLLEASKFYRRHFDIVSKYNVGLKTFLLQGLSEPEFYGDLVYKFRKIIGKIDFPYHFKKIIVRYKKIGYNINVMRQTACLVVNPIKVNSFAYLFNCTTVGRTSD